MSQRKVGKMPALGAPYGNQQPSRMHRQGQQPYEFTLKFTDEELELIESGLYKLSLEGERNDYEQIEALRNKVADADEGAEQ
jgi:hypothetical protein